MYSQPLIAPIDQTSFVSELDVEVGSFGSKGMKPNDTILVYIGEVSNSSVPGKLLLMRTLLFSFVSVLYLSKSLLDGSISAKAPAKYITLLQSEFPPLSIVPFPVTLPK